MSKLGLAGEEPEADDMSQQVLIRSPVTHNHYHDTPPKEQPSQPPQPSQPSPWSKVWPWLLAGAAGLAGAGIPAAIGALRQSPAPVAPVTDSPDIEFPKYDVEKWTPQN